MSQVESEPQASARSSPLWWAVPVIAFLLIGTLGALLGGQEMPHPGSSYDVSGQGYRAVYLMLEELGYPVERSRKPTEGSVRLLLAPSADQAELKALDTWVREGGRMILVDQDTDLADALGLKLKHDQLMQDPGNQDSAGLGAKQIYPAFFVIKGPKPDKVLATIGKDPLVSVYNHEAGEIWVVNRPAIFTNEQIGKADNAVLVTRLVARAMEGRGAPLMFDEFVHGLRDRPTFVALLLRPPALWMTLQGLALLLILLWHAAPRFGVPRPLPPASRRSQEEFLDAMAGLLERKADYAEAFQTARNALAREIERELGLPADTPPDQLAAEVARRRPIDRELLLHVLTTQPRQPGAATGFLLLLNDLEKIHNELFDRSRRDRNDTLELDAR